MLADLQARGYTGSGSPELLTRFADDDLGRLPSLVKELESSSVHVIVTHAVATTIVVKGPHTVPVVYEFSADPVSVGIASDLAHPFYNATGVTLMLAELNAKRLELLQQISPRIRRVAVLANALHPGQHLERVVAEAKARDLGIEVSIHTTRNEAELDSSLGAIAAELPDAMLVFSDAFVVSHRRKILDFAFGHRLPVASGWAVMAESGALCTYGPQLIESYRRVGYFLDRIVRGAKAVDLPIEQPTVFELVVNVSSARKLGLTVPATV
jgi:putative ABC transport system substrate-binding protein